MSTGKLKAQYNRVRTSTALHTTSIWSNTIGLQQEGGTNQAIEASIYAPGGGGGGGRAAKRQRAQELIESSGYQPSVTDFEGLKALARRQNGGDAAANRGACKLCGGLGHLTKQCRNVLDNGNKQGLDGAAEAGGGDDRALLTADDDEAQLLASDSMNSSDLDSDSDRKRKRSSSSKKLSSSKKHKKEKRSKKHKKEKHKKSSRDRKERSRSRSRSKDRTARSGRDRSRSRSPAARRH